MPQIVLTIPALRKSIEKKWHKSRDPCIIDDVLKSLKMHEAPCLENCSQHFPVYGFFFLSAANCGATNKMHEYTRQNSAIIIDSGLSEPDIPYNAHHMHWFSRTMDFSWVINLVKLYYINENLHFYISEIKFEII